MTTPSDGTMVTRLATTESTSARRNYLKAIREQCKIEMIVLDGFIEKYSKLACVDDVVPVLFAGERGHTLAAVPETNAGPSPEVPKQSAPPAKVGADARAIGVRDAARLVLGEEIREITGGAVRARHRMSAGERAFRVLRDAGKPLPFAEIFLRVNKSFRNEGFPEVSDAAIRQAMHLDTDRIRFQGPRARRVTASALRRLPDGRRS